MSGLTRHVSGNREPGQRGGSLVLPGLAACSNHCLGCHPSPAPDIWEVEFKGDGRCYRSFKV